ncbi:MAG: DUF433 domain-containing protein [Phycisphaerales bacterium]|nr:DUF433 domain-containing protein [Phycisphaerales bacterium]
MATNPRPPWQSRVTFEPDKMGGKACIRGLRMPVATVLRCFASGMTRDEILADYPALEAADLDASFYFAASLSR